ncbi:flavin reductase family protein [Labrys sp. ZIDIC5]|uniref:flavin reductase family protein n=1 Tax=Labrys sedimenti TaxID=3106036 RepID=UPI002ACA161D|nr:flavin reductase family protein [Labrys sp. ZIDIC5]MDZ5448537.1 flavin reductase family protein [Labrys sp. ZIDIC5]
MREIDRSAPITPMAWTLPRRPPIDRSEFAETMSNLAATVCVVAGHWQGERQGRTATAVLSLSAEPPSLLVSIDRTCRLAELILASGRFSVAMLASEQETIADAFAGKLGGIDRFSIGDWQNWESGTPRLSSAAASLDCELIGSMSVPTHLVIAGAIVGTELAKTTVPLLWHRRQYHRPAPLSGWPTLSIEEPQPWPTPAD